MQKLRDFRVAGKVNVTHIVQPHDSRQSAGAFHSDPVVEHLDLDVGPFDAVIAVRNGIDDKLLPRELRVFRLRDKARIRAEVGALLDLASHKLQRFLCHLKDAPLKHHILDDVHPCADPCLRSFVTHEADTGAGKEVLRIFAEQQHGRRADFLFSASFGEKFLVLPEVFLRAFPIADP